MTTTLAHAAALLVTAAGLVAAAVTLARTRKFRLSLAILLDFFTAASLLRLVGSQTWTVLGTAALTIVIRQLASHGLVAAQGPRQPSINHWRLRASTIREAFRR